MPQDWRALAAIVDDAVDNQFGDTLEFTPWKKDDEYSPGHQDWDRDISTAIGCYVSPNASVQQADGGFTTPMANTDVMFSIQESYVISKRIQQGDHVTISGRDGTFEIAFISPGDTARSILHLLRLKEPNL